MSKLFLVAGITLPIALASCATKETPAATPLTPPAAVADAPDPEPAAEPTPSPAPAPDHTPAAELTDEQRAAALWKKMNGYKNWAAPGGLDGIRDGESIHGDHIRLFGNATANGDLATLPAGSIIVKEGYRDAEGTLLKAITAMEKIPGYNDEAGDWFFARFNDSGMATRINRGCASCHEDAAGGDFAFIND
jgi:hypothetical protein